MGEWALLGHLLSVFALFVGMVMATSGWHLAKSQAAPGEIALLLGLWRIGPLMVATATVAVLGFGLRVVGDLQGRRLTDGWIGWAILLLVVATAAGIAGGHARKKPGILRSGCQGGDRGDIRAAAAARRSGLGGAEPTWPRRASSRSLPHGVQAPVASGRLPRAFLSLTGLFPMKAT